MRLTNLAPVLMAALVCIIGCGGGSAATPDPNPGPGTAQALIEGNVLLNESFIADADVVAYDLTTGLEVDRAITDLDGHYRLDVPAGQIGLYVTSLSGSALPAWVNVPTTLDTVERDFTLTAGTAGLLVGRVVDRTHGEPVSNAKVTYGAQTASTDGYGFFTMHSVGPNAIGSVHVEAPGFDDESLELRAGQVDRAELVSTAFFTVRPNSDTGTSLGGVLRDITDGAAVGGAILTLSRPIDSTFTPIKRQTNLGGVWRFYNLPTGSYSLEIRRDGFLTQTASAVVNTRDGVLNLFLDPDPAGRATVTGIVRDFNNLTPLNNCAVVASSGAYGRATATTTGSGSYTLSNIVINTPYTIVFTPASARNETITVTVTVPATGLSLDVSLPENGTGGINGRVTQTGQTVPPVGARVAAEKVGEPESGRVFEAFVDSNGNYGLNGLPPGRYKVSASYDSPNGPVSLALTGSTDVIKGQVTKRNITFP